MLSRDDRPAEFRHGWSGAPAPPSVSPTRRNLLPRRRAGCMLSLTRTVDGNPLPGGAMTMSATHFVRMSLVLAMCACAVLPASAQGVGAIGGTITDASGAVLPGAVVTLSNPRGTIGGNQEAVTDARGAFQFIRLVPGAYTVKAELEGFRTAAQENIVVNADVT